MAAKSKDRFSAVSIAVRARNPIAVAARSATGAGSHGPRGRRGERRSAKLAIKRGDY